jgi:hypothetical protein
MKGDGDCRRRALPFYMSSCASIIDKRVSIRGRPSALNFEYRYTSFFHKAKLDIVSWVPQILSTRYSNLTWVKTTTPEKRKSPSTRSQYDIFSRRPRRLPHKQLSTVLSAHGAVMAIAITLPVCVAKSRLEFKRTGFIHMQSLKDTVRETSLLIVKETCVLLPRHWTIGVVQ